MGLAGHTTPIEPSVNSFTDKALEMDVVTVSVRVSADEVAVVKVEVKVEVEVDDSDVDDSFEIGIYLL
jgi:hypothetical protein